MAQCRKDQSWFLAQCKPNRQIVAKRNLLRQGFSIFLPMHEETRRINGKFVTKPIPLFPGYIFVKLGIASGAWRCVNSTYGVTKLVSFGSEPAVVPEDFVNEIASRCDVNGNLLPPKEIRIGDEVVMTRGPFVNQIATIERIEPNRRVFLLIEMMGSQTRVSACAGSLQLVEK
jgi:transcriptional antiterminator RfaH